MKVNPAWASSTAERRDRIRSASRTTVGWRKPAETKAETDRHGIGGNNPPEYDPEAPVTGFPAVMRDVAPFRMQDGTEITSRSKLRDYERAHNVEQVGLEWTASSDVGRPWWWDEFKAHRRENEKRVRAGKPPIPFKQPKKPGKKVETIAVSTEGVHCAKTMRMLK